MRVTNKELRQRIRKILLNEATAATLQASSGDIKGTVFQVSGITTLCNTLTKNDITNVPNVPMIGSHGVENLNGDQNHINVDSYYQFKEDNALGDALYGFIGGGAEVGPTGEYAIGQMSEVLGYRFFQNLNMGDTAGGPFSRLPAGKMAGAFQGLDLVLCKTDEDFRDVTKTGNTLDLTSEGNRTFVSVKASVTKDPGGGYKTQPPSLSKPEQSAALILYFWCKHQLEKTVNTGKTGDRSAYQSADRQLTALTSAQTSAKAYDDLVVELIDEIIRLDEPFNVPNMQFRSSLESNFEERGIPDELSPSTFVGLNLDKIKSAFSITDPTVTKAQIFGTRRTVPLEEYKYVRDNFQTMLDKLRTDLVTYTQEVKDRKEKIYDSAMTDPAFGKGYNDLLGIVCKVLGDMGIENVTLNYNAHNLGYFASGAATDYVKSGAAMSGATIPANDHHHVFVHSTKDSGGYAININTEAGSVSGAVDTTATYGEKVAVYLTSQKVTADPTKFEAYKASAAKSATLTGSPTKSEKQQRVGSEESGGLGGLTDASPLRAIQSFQNNLIKAQRISKKLAGGNNYITKPFVGDELTNQINDLTAISAALAAARSSRAAGKQEKILYFRQKNIVDEVKASLTTLSSKINAATSNNSFQILLNFIDEVATNFATIVEAANDPSASSRIDISNSRAISFAVLSAVFGEAMDIGQISDNEVAYFTSLKDKIDQLEVLAFDTDPTPAEFLTRSPLPQEKALLASQRKFDVIVKLITLSGKNASKYQSLVSGLKASLRSNFNLALLVALLLGSLSDAEFETVGLIVERVLRKILLENEGVLKITPESVVSSLRNLKSLVSASVGLLEVLESPIDFGFSFTPQNTVMDRQDDSFDQAGAGMNENYERILKKILYTIKKKQ